MQILLIFRTESSVLKTLSEFQTSSAFGGQLAIQSRTLVCVCSVNKLVCQYRQASIGVDVVGTLESHVLLLFLSTGPMCKQNAVLCSWPAQVHGSSTRWSTRSFFSTESARWVCFLAAAKLVSGYLEITAAIKVTTDLHPVTIRA